MNTKIKNKEIKKEFIKKPFERLIFSCGNKFKK